MIKEKYPVKKTRYPTPFDEMIVQKTKWLKEKYPYFWSKLQEAPSELSFKIYVLSLIHKDYIKQVVGDEENEIFASIKTQDELYDHPDISLEDFMWCLISAVNTPLFLQIIDKMNRFKEEHDDTEA